jgi:peptidoglycan/xylan/chitin deacetylase (PgdA/CDA1 family)
MTGVSVLAAFLLFLTVSCATPPAAVPFKEAPGVPPALPPEEPVERQSERQPEGIDAITWMVKNKPHEMRNYLQLDESLMIVKALVGGFEVSYDIRNSIPLAGAGTRYVVGFSVLEKKTGALRTDELIWTLEDDDSGLLLSLDDNYEENWEARFDLFETYGARLTFFVCGGPSPFCLKALEKGHDIGCHTLNHLNLLKVPQRVFFEETLTPAALFKEAGIPLSSFAYPFGFSEPWMRDSLADSFGIQRGFGTRYRLYQSDTIKGAYVSSISIDTILYKTDEDFEDALSLMLKTAKFLGGILPLTSHDISDTAPWGISPRRLEYVLRTAKALKLKFFRYRDFS